MKRWRPWGYLAVLVLGLLLWMAGALDLLGEHHLLMLCVLLAGGVLVASGGLMLLGTPASGALPYGREEALCFCAAFGVGLGAIGFAVSPLTSWLLPGLLFAAGGIALMVWASHALGRSSG